MTRLTTRLENELVRPCKLGETCYEIIRGKIVEHPLIKADFPYLDKIYGTYEEAAVALAKETTEMETE